METKQYSPPRKKFLIGHIFTILLLIGCILAIFLWVNPSSGESLDSDFTTPEWLEPRGITVIDAVGEVPESHLKDLILIFQVSQGIIQYVSGNRVGDTVTINASSTFYDPNVILCLGAGGRFDEWPVVVPNGTIRIFSAGIDVTSRVESTYSLYPATLDHPSNSTAHVRRYPKEDATIEFDTQGRIVMPANMGCELEVSGDPLTDVTLEYTFESPRRVSITPIYEETGDKYSWIGGRNTTATLGILQGLNEQLWAFNDAHAGQGDYSDIGKLAPWGRTDGFTVDLDDVNGADYVLHKFPPMAVNVVFSDNANSTNPLKSGGSWRINSGKNDYLPSVDHTSGVLIPLRANWRDADQAPNMNFLPYFSQFQIITIPEYIIPPGVDYHPCMANGGCSNSILASIFRTRFETSVYYYDVERVSADLKQVPLRSVGPNWNRNARELAADIAAQVGSNPHKVYIPHVSTPVEITPINDTLDCPCGWFDEIGRMYDFVAPN